VVSRHQTTQQYGVILPIELTTDEIRNSKAYKEYYACAMGEAAPKPKASARKKKGDSSSSTTPPTPTPTTTVESASRLSATAKGKQPSRAITPTEPTNVQRTDAKQLKIVLQRSRQETHISQRHGFGIDERTGSKPGVPDVPFDDSEEEISWNSFDDEDVGGHKEGNKFDESDDERDEGSDDDSDEYVKAGAGKDDDDNDDEDNDDNDEEEELAKSDEEDTETVINKYLTGKNSGVDSFRLNSKAYKEYYACAMGEAAPKPKASARKKKGDSSSSTTPPTPTPTTTVESASRLSATAKGKQPSRAITPTEPTNVQRTDAKQLKIVEYKNQKRSNEMYYPRFTKVIIDYFMTRKPSISRRNRINWHYVRDDVMFSTIKVAAAKPKASARKKKAGAGKDDDDNNDEDDDDNDEEEELAKSDEEDTETGKGSDEVSKSKGESEEEETRQEEEESFDLIPRTPEENEDESNDEEDKELQLSEEARIQKEEEADELYRDVNINQGRGLQVTQNVEDTHVTLTPVNPDGPQESSSVSSFVTIMLNSTSDVGVESIFTTASSLIVSL
nr:hypothetical protein [Tanacetum cinerariifolium]